MKNLKYIHVFKLEKDLHSLIYYINFRREKLIKDMFQTSKQMPIFFLLLNMLSIIIIIVFVLFYPLLSTLSSLYSHGNYTKINIYIYIYIYIYILFVNNIIFRISIFKK